MVRYTLKLQYYLKFPKDKESRAWLFVSQESPISIPSICSDELMDEGKTLNGTFDTFFPAKSSTDRKVRLGALLEHLLAP